MKNLTFVIVNLLMFELGVAWAISGVMCERVHIYQGNV